MRPNFNGPRSGFAQMGCLGALSLSSGHRSAITISLVLAAPFKAEELEKVKFLACASVSSPHFKNDRKHHPHLCF